MRSHVTFTTPRFNQTEVHPHFIRGALTVLPAPSAPVHPVDGPRVFSNQWWAYGSALKAGTSRKPAVR